MNEIPTQWMRPNWKIRAALVVAEYSPETVRNRIMKMIISWAGKKGALVPKKHG